LAGFKRTLTNEQDLKSHSILWREEKISHRAATSRSPSIESRWNDSERHTILKVVDAVTNLDLFAKDAILIKHYIGDENLNYFF
jgi:hypothetical protein